MEDKIEVIFMFMKNMRATKLSFEKNTVYCKKKKQFSATFFV